MDRSLRISKDENDVQGAFPFRVPVIPGINDSEPCREIFHAFAGDDVIEYLPYNNAAGVKYRMLGRKYALEAVSYDR